MERREFVQRGATLAGGAAVLGFTRPEARGDQGDVAPELASLGSKLADAPTSLSPMLV